MPVILIPARRPRDVWLFRTRILPQAAPAVISPGGLHHIWCGIGDTGEGARVAQTLHTIELGISA